MASSCSFCGGDCASSAVGACASRVRRLPSCRNRSCSVAAPCSRCVLGSLLVPVSPALRSALSRVAARCGLPVSVVLATVCPRGVFPSGGSCS